MKNIQKMRKLLIITNCILLLMSTTLFIKGGYHNKLKEKIESFAKNPSVSDKQLLLMNNESTMPFIDINKGKGDRAINIVIIGNSLLTHPISEKIGWTHVSGMAASSIEKDYVHVLLDSLSDRLPDTAINFRISNFASFERNPNTLERWIVDSLVSFKPTIVIFQLGENINEKKDLHLFKKKYIELIKLFKEKNDAVTICTTPFFPSALKNNTVESVSLETKSYLIDLSSLVLLDSENYAKNEKDYIGDKSLWKVDGIGAHPGDVGMKNIANRLFVVINTLLDNEKHTKMTKGNF